MKIAVVGAGLFGLDCALKLAESHEVHVFEKENAILLKASCVNQRRIHKGYHYPRSPETVKELNESLPLFYEKYSRFIDHNNEHYYCISKDNSVTSKTQYLKFCYDNNLDFLNLDLDLLNKDLIDLTIKVNEGILNIDKLRQHFYQLIIRLGTQSKIELNLNTTFLKKHIKDFDFVVNATYANLNDLLNKEDKKNYQYELCEKIIVRLPEELRNKSIVVMDGPFFCLDPYEDTGCHLVGHVKHAIQATNTGHKPEHYSKYKSEIDYIKTGINRNFIFDDIKRYIKLSKDPEYISSFMIYRAVLPNVEKTDERPTIVSQNGNIINVFSGKLATCCKATLEVEKIINKGKI